VAAANPLVHWVRFGAAEHRRPHPLIDLDDYLARNPDLGAPGTDPVYGRGLVNLAAALGPQGPLSVPLGSAVEEGGAPLAGSALTLGPAFGAGPALGRAIFVDGYGRPYWLDLEERVAVGEKVMTTFWSLVPLPTSPDCAGSPLLLPLPVGISTPPEVK